MTESVDEHNSSVVPKVKLGEHVYSVGSGKLGELRDSTALRNEPAALRERLREDGYIFLRGVVPQDTMTGGRELVLRHLEAQSLIDSQYPLEDAVVAGQHGGDQGRVKGTEDLIRTPEFLAVVEHTNLFKLFDDIFGAPSATFDFKWLRAVQPGESSGFHMDSVYMHRGSPNLLTCWLPFCDVPWDLGGLTVLSESHNCDGYKRIRDTYGELDLDRDEVGGTGWFTEDPEEALHFGGRFKTAHFAPGDVVLFPMKTLHGSSVNTTNRWRISCDVRFQPKDEPIDSRWIRDSAGEINGLKSRWSEHRNDKLVFPKTMEDAKREWDVHWRDNCESNGNAKRSKLTE